MKNIPWSTDEIDLVLKYFNSNITEATLFQQITEVEPSRSYEAMMRKIRHMIEDGLCRKRDKALKKLRIGFLDIEASGLDADFSPMISWCIKPLNKKEIECDFITQKDIINFGHDKRILMSLLKAMENYDLLVTQYGTDRRFDIPFIRTRAFKHGIQSSLPRYMERLMSDTWSLARNKLRLHSNRLDSIADALRVKIKKTPLSGKIWELARSGHKESINYILQHNKNDVLILEEVYLKLKQIEGKPSYRSI